MPPELHRGPFHVPACKAREMLPDLDRTGEGDFSDFRRRQQRLRQVGRVAPEDVETAVRQPGLLHQPADRDRGGGGFPRSLEDNGAAARKRRHDLAQRLAEGEIPRREGDADPDRLAKDHLLHARIAGGNDPPVDAARFLRMPIGMVGGETDLADRLAERLALVARHVTGDLVGMLAREVCEAAQDPAPLERRAILPALESALRRGHGFGNLAIGRKRQPDNRLARRGITTSVLRSASYIQRPSISMPRRS